MKRELAILSWMFLLSACGGGGGGGSASPANVSPNGGDGGTVVGDKSTGIFVDSPVSGLSYQQGNLFGITTDAGEFTYDSKSEEKVLFSAGGVLLGGVSGRSVVTPFDLDSPSGTVSYNRGVNVARLLITLDEDKNPINGIALSSSAATLIGNLPFDLSPAEFSEDSHVNTMLDIANVDQLVDAGVALAHMASNKTAMAGLATASAAVTAMGKMDFRWNPNASETGVLFDLKSENGERLIALADFEGKGYLASVLYKNAAKNYVFLSFNARGDIVAVDINGNLRKPVRVMNQYSNTDYLLSHDLENYKPPENFAIVDAQTGAVSNIKKRHQNQILQIVQYFELLEKAVVAREDALHLASGLMLDVEKVLCDAAKNCGNGAAMITALQVATNDVAYRDAMIRFQELGSSALDMGSICIEIAGAKSDIRCGGLASLESYLSGFNVARTSMLAIWNNRLVSFQPPSEMLRLAKFEYSYHARYQSDYPSVWRLENGPVPDPWLRAFMEFNPDFRLTRLSNGAYYYELSLVPRDGLMHFMDCRYVLKEGSEYRESCPSTTVADTEEKRAIVQLKNDVMKLVDKRSGFFVSPTNENVIFDDYVNNYRYIGLKTEADVREFDILSENIVEQLTFGKSRYVKYMVNSFLYPEVDPYYNEHFSISGGITNHAGQQNKIGFIVSGRIQDSRLRSEFGFFNILAAVQFN